MTPEVKAFFHESTSTLTYVVYDRPGGRGAVIDPVLDYEAAAGRTATIAAEQVIEFATANALAIDWILETHAHADHLSAATYLRQALGAKVAIGESIGAVQRTCRALFDLEPAFQTDGSQFDRLFADQASFEIGALTGRVLAVPGHTPADVAYWIGDAVFVGDTLFMPDVGTARCDFPGGDACKLYRSIRKLLALPPETRVFVCHDYPPVARGPRWQCSVAEQRASNIHVHDGVSEDAFIAMRTARDATLATPVLFVPSLQVNIRAGALPPRAANGISYVKVPLNVL